MDLGLRKDKAKAEDLPEVHPRLMPCDTKLERLVHLAPAVVYSETSDHRGYRDELERSRRSALDTSQHEAGGFLETGNNRRGE